MVPSDSPTRGDARKSCSCSWEAVVYVPRCKSYNKLQGVKRGAWRRMREGYSTGGKACRKEDNLCPLSIGKLFQLLLSISVNNPASSIPSF